jgi:hypothetical protein
LTKDILSWRVIAEEIRAVKSCLLIERSPSGFLNPSKRWKWDVHILVFSQYVIV